MRENHGRGFAGMDPQRQREIASMGGRAAHESGRAHEWSSAEARHAGHLGGIAARHHRQANAGKKAESVEPKPQTPENAKAMRSEEGTNEQAAHTGATPPAQQGAGADVETTRKASDDMKARTWDVGSSDDEEARKLAQNAREKAAVQKRN